jgi:holin-like protein
LSAAISPEGGEPAAQAGTGETSNPFPAHHKNKVWSLYFTSKTNWVENPPPNQTYFSIFTCEMRIPLQLAVIFAICVAGEFLHRIVGIPLPGNIIGMVLLLILLCLKAIKPEQISGVSSFFLNHLALFFLPPSIAIMAVGDDVLSKWPLLLFLCIVFTLVTLAIAGLVTQFFIRKQEYRENLALRAERLAKRTAKANTSGGAK